ncbi:MAG TPA: PhnD/SsuA/transferrin family substrate-binding protein [Pirellulales bacterium]|nr:PhnD/SsuA/transferrin family substrate-binding protein [Pirellulales bacterium]
MVGSAADFGSPSDSSGHSGPGTQRLPLVRVILYLGLAAAVAVIIVAGVQTIRATASLHESQDRTAATFDITTPAPRHLAADYTDRDGRLLADCPSDPQKLLNPDTLVLSYGEDSDLDIQPVNWDDFQKYLAQITGKKVVAQAYTNTVDDVLAIKEGRVHVVALHAADAPYLVNNAGLIPVAVLGYDQVAAGNHLDLAVAPASNIKTLGDIRGRTLTCTRPTSVTGYRAAIAVLLRDAKLRPDVDYIVNYSFGQRRSIQGLAAGDYEVVALSDDKLQSLVKAGEIKSSDYRLVYESQVIPRFTIGYVYNLQPELAAKITEAILGFKNEHASRQEGSEEPMRFFAVDYKKDFEFVRRIDESFDPRLGSKKANPKAKADSSGDGSGDL